MLSFLSRLVVAGRVRFVQLVGSILDFETVSLGVAGVDRRQY